MDSKHQTQLHFLLIPLMAQGHLIPMIDMAHLLASRGHLVTIVTTQLTASRLQPKIDRALSSGLHIHLLSLHFPSQQVGLPEGCETLDDVTSLQMILNFFKAIEMQQQPVENFIQTHPLYPSCIISDMGITWTTETSQKLHIPRFVLHSTCCFSLLCYLKLSQCSEEGNIESEMEEFFIPDLPHRIRITKAQIPEIFRSGAIGKEFRDRIKEVEQKADGMVVNSFYELEPEYVESYQKAKGKKAWTIGPVSLCNKGVLDKAERGKASSVSERECLNWLDSKKPKSVIYVCFGSLCRLQAGQLMELGLGLEGSKQNFIWVIRGGDSGCLETEKWLGNGFEERVRERGLIIRGWAPQMLILSHPSTAAFLTHCGWNSTLEAVCAGVPILTWPLYSEQFLNEKLGVDVLGIGVRAGCEKGGNWWEQEEVKEVVRREVVERGVEIVMEVGEEGEGRRRRAREYGEKAILAMEVGGSSYNNITGLIEYVMQKGSERVCGSSRN